MQKDETLVHIGGSTGAVRVILFCIYCRKNVILPLIFDICSKSLLISLPRCSSWLRPCLYKIIMSQAMASSNDHKRGPSDTSIFKTLINTARKIVMTLPHTTEAPRMVVDEERTSSHDISHLLVVGEPK